MNNGIDGGEAFGPGAVLALFRHGQTHTRNDLMRLTGLAQSTSGLALRGSLHRHFVTTIAAYDCLLQMSKDALSITQKLEIPEIGNNTLRS